MVETTIKKEKYDKIRQRHKGPGYSMKMGLLSGYSKCCIKYFIKTNIEQKRNNPRIRRGRYKSFHILCPKCVEKYKKEYWKLKYYDCPICGWFQFSSEECNLCKENI